MFLSAIYGLEFSKLESEIWLSWLEDSKWAEQDVKVRVRL